MNTTHNYSRTSRNHIVVGMALWAAMVVVLLVVILFHAVS